VYWRRIARSKRPDRVFDAVAEVIAETGILRGRRQRCVDSTVFDDAVATQDTMTQLVAAIGKVARVVPGTAEVIDRVCTLDYSQPGKPPIDWDDPLAQQTLVSDLVNDARAHRRGSASTRASPRSLPQPQGWGPAGHQEHTAGDSSPVASRGLMGELGIGTGRRCCQCRHSASYRVIPASVSSPLQVSCSNTPVSQLGVE
jgi:hypothetical protein